MTSEGLRAAFIWKFIVFGGGRYEARVCRCLVRPVYVRITAFLLFLALVSYTLRDIDRKGARMECRSVVGSNYGTMTRTMCAPESFLIYGYYEAFKWANFKPRARSFFFSLRCKLSCSFLNTSFSFTTAEANDGFWERDNNATIRPRF